jgi:hypothetical protein
MHAPSWTGSKIPVMYYEFTVVCAFITLFLHPPPKEDYEYSFVELYTACCITAYRYGSYFSRELSDVTRKE